MAKVRPKIYRRYLYCTGLSLCSEEKIFEDFIIRPGSLQLTAEELRPLTDYQRGYGLICAVAGVISFEVEVQAKDEKSVAIAAWNANWVLILLSIICRHQVDSNCTSSDSLSSCDIKHIRATHSFISPRVFAKPRKVTPEEIEECRTLALTYNKLLENERFSFACSVVHTNFSEPKVAIRIASIWSAIESILDVEHELRFKISLYAAYILENEPLRRQSKIKQVQRLYDERSKCVHGGRLKKERQNVSYEEALDLLCSLLIHFMRAGKVYNKSELDGMILGMKTA